MKKLIFAVAVACGCAQFAQAEQVQNWFTGGASGSETWASGGTWSQPSAGVTVADGKFDIDLAYDELLDYAPTSEVAPDTNVMTRVVVAGSTFTPCYGALPTFGDDAPKTALVVSNAAYYAYAAGAWIKLTGDVTPSASAVDVLIEVDYKYATPRARFGIIDGTTTNFLKEVGAADDSWLALAGSTPNPALITKVAFGGGGELASVCGDVQLGVASYSSVKYPTVQEAVNAAGTTVDAQVKVLRNNSETVTIEDGQKIALDTNGKTCGTVINNSSTPVQVDVPAGIVAEGNGEYTFDVSITGTGGYTVKTSDATKQVAYKTEDNKVVATVTTADAEVNGISLGGATSLAGSSNGDLRTFLDGYVHEVYSGQGSTTVKMQTEMAKDGDNGLKKWQSFVLGIDPETGTLATQPTGTDNDLENFHISIPDVTTKNSGFTVAYKLNDTVVDDPKDITIPVGTGTYTIKAVLTPNN